MRRPAVFGPARQELASVRAFLREVYAQRPKGWRTMNPLDDQAAQLTLIDIGRYLGLHYQGLRYHTRALPAKSCVRGCVTMDDCYNCDARWMNPGLREALATFMLRWYAGEIRKVRGPHGWQLMDIRPPSTPMGAPPRTALTQPLALMVDRRTLTLKVK